MPIPGRVKKGAEIPKGYISSIFIQCRSLNQRKRERKEGKVFFMDRVVCTQRYRVRKCMQLYFADKNLCVAICGKGMLPKDDPGDMGQIDMVHYEHRTF